MNYHNEYSKLLLSEKLIDRPTKFAQFDEGFKLVNKVNNFLMQFINFVNYENLNDIWLNNQNISINLNDLNLNIVFEQEVLEQDTLAAFDFNSQPYSLFINLSNFKDKILTKESLNKFLNSNTFKTILAHELFHLVQTKTYGEEEMKKNGTVQQDISNYQASPIELEACIFMILENAILNNKHIYNYNELIQYTQNITDDYLLTAKYFVMHFPDDVIKIINNNDKLCESLSDVIQQDVSKINFTVSATNKHRPRKLI